MPASKPKKVGRPSLPKGNAKAATVRVRSTPNELRAYEMAAKAQKQSLVGMDTKHVECQN